MKRRLLRASRTPMARRGIPAAPEPARRYSDDEVVFPPRDLRTEVSACGEHEVQTAEYEVDILPWHVGAPPGIAPGWYYSIAGSRRRLRSSLPERIYTGPYDTDHAAMSAAIEMILKSLGWREDEGWDEPIEVALRAAPDHPAMHDHDALGEALAGWHPRPDRNASACSQATLLAPSLLALSARRG